MKTRSSSLVIDTDKYAGNFDRDLTAYCTRIIGECGRGDDLAQKYSGMYFENVLRQVTDEHGCRRPCAIHWTPDLYNDGLGGVYREGEEKSATETYKKSCEKHGIEFKKLGRYPAMRSVEIFFRDEPENSQLEAIREKCYEFCQQKEIKITGFRLKYEETIENYDQLWD